MTTIIHNNIRQWVWPGSWFLAIALLLAMGYSPPAMTAVYKWVDEQGNVHYGNRPPADVESERMKVKIPPKYSTDQAEQKIDEAKPGTEQTGDQSKQQAQQPAQPVQQPEQPKMSRKEKALMCKNARDRLQNAQAYARIREYDDKGNSRILSEKERQQRIARAKKDIRQYCR